MTDSFDQDISQDFPQTAHKLHQDRNPKTEERKKSYISPFKSELNITNFQESYQSKVHGFGNLAPSALSSSSNIAIRKEPTLEFFQMCLLSHKMNNQYFESVMELDHRRLYKKCVEEESK